MLSGLCNWWQHNFWLGSACTLVGLVVISPFLLSKSFRKWFARNDVDIDSIGLLVLLVVIATLAVYNWLGSSGGV